MDVKYVNPFIEAFNTVMPQLGFGSVRIGKLGAKSKDVVSSGIIIVLGIVGAIRGNIVYTLNIESAKLFASTIMMSMPIEEIDEMAKSALSELTNMLTAHAATRFAELGLAIDISTPTTLQGENISVKMGSDQILSVELLADENPMEINIAFDN